MDKFHDYLSSQLDRLDADPPGGNIWDRIETTMSTKKRGRTVNHLSRYLVAASVIILVAAGLWITDQQTVHIQKDKTKTATLPQKKDSIEITVADNKPVINSRPVETLSEKEKPEPAITQQPMEKLSEGYAALISSRLQQLRTTPVYAECTDYFSDFTVQLEQMDKDELGIQQDIGHYGMQDALVEQLILIYERKLKLLKELQTQIARMNRKAGTRNNVSNRAQPCFINL